MHGVLIPFSATYAFSGLNKPFGQVYKKNKIDTVWLV